MLLRSVLLYFDRCYLFDSKAFLVMDPDFLIASALDESKYEQVQLGTKEGEVMKDLIYKHGFFDRGESIDFQGSCHITPEEPKVSDIQIQHFVLKIYSLIWVNGSMNHCHDL